VSGKTLQQRFQERFDDSGGPDACWLWTGTMDAKGYGRIGFGQLALYAHRVAWELAGRVIPEGHTLDHLCRVKHCVNVAHLEPVTGGENTTRAHRVNYADGCRRGHSWAEHGTVNSKGARVCRACARAADAAYRERRRQATS